MYRVGEFEGDWVDVPEVVGVGDEGGELELDEV